jgi:hypothetical protein
MKKPAPSDSRPKQETPAAMLHALTRIVRRQFCPDLTDDDWYPHLRFIKRVLTYGASYLNKRGVTLPPARYEAIYQDIFQGIKAHGQTGSIGYWPGYLLRCVQSHFKHHGDEYYEEGKNMRALAERALYATQRAQEAAQAADPLEAYAQAHAVLAARKRRPGARPAKGPKQEDLFSL